MVEQLAPKRPRGRPTAAQTVPEETILAVALRQFATLGYDGASLRTINRELGVSHNLLYQRFGTKEELWRAAVDFGFGGLVEELRAAADPAVTDPLERLRLNVRQFLVYSGRHPELLTLMNSEGCQDTDRVRYVYRTYIEPSQAPTFRLLDELAAQGIIRPIEHRTFFFLVTHGGAAPFSLVPLARLFDDTAPDEPDRIVAHADLVSTVLIAGLCRPAAIY